MTKPEGKNRKELHLRTVVEKIKTSLHTIGNHSEEYTSEITSLHWLEAETIRKAHRQGYSKVTIDGDRIVYDVAKCMAVLEKQHDPIWEDESAIPGEVTR